VTRIPPFARRVLLVLGLLSLTMSAWAQGLGDRRLGVRWDGGSPRLAFSARDLVDDPDVRRALASGVSKRIVLTAQAYRVGSTRPFATRTRECHITYDLWQESYVVQIGSRRGVEPDLEAAVRRCLVVRNFAVGRSGDFDRYRGDQVYFAVRAEFNPISARRCREALRGSGGNTDPIGALVVNIVRRDICGADRAIDFRSQPVVVPGGGR
tara:strand:- start:1091 stop:1720 length:630 start_codon:yes stop_codon:yes gene_type:complete